MDPLALQASNLGVVRPAIALQADVAAVLRQGRVLAGEVLQSFGGGALILGIGRHRVPAQSQVSLAEGHRFLFVVEGEGENLVLRMLGEESAVEPSLLRALRRVLGQDQPLGRLLESLLLAVRGRGLAPELTAELMARQASMEGGVGRLAAQLRDGGGLSYEARLAGAAALSLPTAEAARLAADLEAWLVERLSGWREAAGTPQGWPLADELLQGLRTEFAHLLGAGNIASERERAFAAWLGTQPSALERGRAALGLPQLLEVAIERLFEGSVRDALLARLRGASLGMLGRGLEVLLVRRLLGLGPPPPALVEDHVREAVQQTRTDLKGLLLQALSALPEGPERQAVARALGGLEAEQLLNVARRSAGEATHWSLPLAEGARWTTAHLFLEPRRSAEAGPGSQEGEQLRRLTLALELSSTGPVRADLLALPGTLLVRVQAERPAVVAALSAGLGELQARLGIGGRQVQVSVGAAAPEDLRLEDSTADVRLLRENHLMDLRA